MNNCSICGRDFMNPGSLGMHKKNCIPNSLMMEIVEDYRYNQFSIKELEIKYSINKNRFLSFIKPYSRSMAEAVRIAHKKYIYKHSDETKQLMKEKRLKWMKDNPEKTAWRQANMSYPEKLFLEKIKELGWDNKYFIVREKSFFPYFVDFAFENYKLAIEIDGSQHQNPDRKAKDDKKDALLIDSGWRVLRITAEEVKTNIDNCFNIISDILTSNNEPILTKIGIYKDSELRKVKCISCGKDISSAAKTCTRCHGRKNVGLGRKADRPPYMQLLKEVEDNGYCHTGRKYGVSDTAIRKWIKVYEKYPDTI